ncbi:MAG: sugar phosphate isomerase/epimerase [Clostridiales bacterium]|nr:sugar phosphate isomerase/epimerase [Clostridiales bacterium]
MLEGVGEVSHSSYDILKAGVEKTLENGFDFAEATVGLIMGLTDDEMALASAIRNLEVCNSFVPPSLPIIKGDSSKLEEHVKESMTRMQKLGVDTVVFGSGGARRIPDGMDRKEGMRWIEDFLTMCNEYAVKHNITVAVEPLNQKECNILTSVTEGAELVEKLQLGHIRLLADSYHMARENEPLSVLADAAHLLVHVHISEADRTFPGKYNGTDLPAFVDQLKAVGYKARISAESGFTDFVTESAIVATYMRRITE